MTIEEKYQTQRSDFMQALCSLLPFGEWNNTLLENAENKCDFARAYTYVLFPAGLKEVVDYFEEWHDNRMLQSLAQINTPNKIKEKIALALKIRIIELNTKFMSIKNCTYFSLPTNTKLGVKVGWRTCDAIWNYVGDESIDYNYYSKRSLLLTAYITSIMYYISDDSENYVNTRNFIDETLNDIINISFKLRNTFQLPKLEGIPFIRLFS
jgi:ubiquinone biosynthesis protein COQ9